MTTDNDTQVSEGWYSDEAATFGDRLAGAREAADMTQKQLARRLGVKLKTVAAWENDVAEPRANKLQMLAGLLNVSIMWLLTGTGDGLTAPEDSTRLEGDARAVQLELRALKADMENAADRIARLEKSLRNLLGETTA